MNIKRQVSRGENSSFFFLFLFFNRLLSLYLQLVSFLQSKMLVRNSVKELFLMIIIFDIRFGFYCFSFFSSFRRVII